MGNHKLWKQQWLASWEELATERHCAFVRSSWCEDYNGHWTWRIGVPLLSRNEAHVAAASVILAMYQHQCPPVMLLNRQCKLQKHITLPALSNTSQFRSFVQTQRRAGTALNISFMFWNKSSELDITSCFKASKAHYTRNTAEQLREVDSLQLYYSSETAIFNSC